MDRKTLDDTSKFLSYVLRHQPEAIGLTLDGEGWADIDALIAGAARDGRALDRMLLGAVVENNDKKRFALSADGQRIRAVQGHSHAAVAIAYAPAVPPAVLYHGTASRFLDSIRERGLVPGSRHHVHGRRYGSPVLLEIDARDMHLAGHLFHQAENGVWLTERVPVRFIREA
ncbi:RNA 2'-phosphotransferase [Pseudomonas aeruginosa M10]|uniref:RNA 2'-phosphotransferase n=1 Tax=Pseudomonas aeruginosa TaxID=287 RepID=UPI00044B0675|nr:RNA 2'-phosphotransferase [Pseudomonas aeruginosa]KAJ14987.1 RNA 2'-phosphotransferase [Pseudomonas aeruginosa M10]